jgi:hypothetical protein
VLASKVNLPSMGTPKKMMKGRFASRCTPLPALPRFSPSMPTSLDALVFGTGRPFAKNRFRIFVNLNRRGLFLQCEFGTRHGYHD